MSKKKLITSSPPSGGQGGLSGAAIKADAVTEDTLAKALGTKNLPFNANLFFRTVRTAFIFQGDGINPAEEEKIAQTAALVGLKAFKPTDPVEAMLAAQAVMLHNLAMEAGRRAQLPQQQADVASKLRKDAANAARAMTDMCEALDRRRGKGPQVVRVERVVVHEGGQAIVGQVQAGVAPRSLGQGAPLVALPEADLVLTGEGEA